MLFKLKNRLVDRRISRNSTFLLVFSKVHEILSLKQSSFLGVCRCSLIAGVPKTACIFQRKSILANKIIINGHTSIIDCFELICFRLMQIAEKGSLGSRR